MIRDKDRPVVADDVFLGRPLEMTRLECPADFTALLGRLLNRINELSESVIVLAESVDEAKLSMRRIEDKERRVIDKEWYLIRSQAKDESKKFFEAKLPQIRADVAYLTKRASNELERVKDKLWEAMKALDRDNRANRLTMAGIIQEMHNGK
tara:strand:+ start:525 stop:980 length:456 start_codon:yes stop_codon:yes gene_type:complete